ncbi:3,4-dihydroxy-2-butanone-4-phosphate synthase [Desulfocurvus sp.]|jgi:3,4-dihydroxy 2-butanone 4-phosphate synthase|uniref:3,4-dihydroxy-2-butanone-4-phosphate synthase n=1 Tax=Desulfocurvus sp. TaxID=2871698 RepID=UPI0025BE31C2|nr:3,4-dihydroxy-2-butanone-4-phosphate synthase [Desulfocurvus sp.]MCK9239532.1 3,4-dihydroxy-2-butanone-4-phosphate synthase [Desulfocurvus sp.]
MHESLLSPFGSPRQRVESALDALRAGRGVLAVDDEDRENEGDLFFAAQSVTPAQMALLIRECSGIVCLCLTPDKVRALDLPMMVAENTSAYGTGFTVSIEAARGVTTGVSAADRVATVRAAVAQDARPADLRRPGHVFPLCARPGGVLERRGHTEANVDLMRLAGLAPCGVLCELTNADGSMARLPGIVAFARRHAMPVVTVQDVVDYRLERDMHLAAAVPQGKAPAALRS